jgi:hypothetical protein
MAELNLKFGDVKMKILSLGAGVQSSTIAMMCEHGLIDKPDYAIFADTGWEMKHILPWLDWLETQLSFPVVRVSAGNLKEDLINSTNSTGQRFAAVPFFTDNGGMGRRQCTNEYKIQPIRKKCRELLGYESGKRVPENAIEMMIGISKDEIQRMKPSDRKWIKNIYPLIDLRMTRWDCLQWMKQHGYPEPPKSSCGGCPYHDDKLWNDLKKTDEWQEIVLVDAAIRKQPGFKHSQFMHKSLKPIDEAVFKIDDQTIDMFGNECTGYCGV